MSQLYGNGERLILGTEIGLNLVFVLIRSSISHVMNFLLSLL